MEQRQHKIPVKLAYPFLSLVILFFLVGQALITSRVLCPPRSLSSLNFLRQACSPAAYPFLDYPMFMDAHYPGEELPRVEVIGIWEDATTVKLYQSSLGMDKWLFGDFVDAIMKDRYQQVEGYLEYYNQRNAASLVGVRLDNHPLIFTGSQLVPGERQTLKEMRLDP